MALKSGLTRRDLRSERFVRPFNGLYSVRRLPLLSGGESAAAVQQARILDAAAQFASYMAVHEFFSHTTAALVWAIPLPLLADDKLHVSVCAPHRAPRGVGVRGHQLAGRRVELATHPGTGLPVTSPAATWALLGTILRHPYDLVAAADALLWTDRVGGPHGGSKRAALASATTLEDAIPFRRKGALALREALPRVRAGAASRPETWLRLTIVDAGIPEPVADLDVYDDRGRYLGTIDLGYPERKIALEYEGDHHRTDRDQWNRDLRKHRALMAAGWHVVRVTSQMLFGDTGPLLAEIRRAIRASSLR
ncbi:endonuclease domain-containing protein [Microbacterium sp. ASV49]|uniref:DUF559 domain-containing protein n=1 Tax=Microbacterium candidum TaxID=3041922 RepID=A0ABT7N190_9MICO|nr:hypothetical protein [Microbacterium sp. ASV49]MDL9980474.1 hypothetical protein [Microbacterium sp. ASV49]